MTQTTIDNGPVMEVITNGNTVTVPPGETWQVTITCQPAAAGISDRSGESQYVRVEIDGVFVAGAEAHADAMAGEASGSASSTVPMDATLAEGTIIGASGGSVFVSGFKV